MKSFPRYAVVYHDCKSSVNRAILLDKVPSLASLWQRAETFEDVFCIFDNRVTHLFKTRDGVFQLQAIRPDEILSVFSGIMISITKVKL